MQAWFADAAHLWMGEITPTLTRYILRKEFLQDIRGLRRDLPQEAGRESRTRASDLRRLRDAA